MGSYENIRSIYDKIWDLSKEYSKPDYKILKTTYTPLADKVILETRDRNIAINKFFEIVQERNENENKISYRLLHRSKDDTWGIVMIYNNFHEEEKK